MASFDVPKGAVAQVSIIDSTTRIHGLPAMALLQPAMEGMETFPAIGSWSFLVQSSTGRKVLFDLGSPADKQLQTPAVVKEIETAGMRFDIEKDVADVLADNGMDVSEIESVIWSHHHFDHIGNVTTFPSTTKLVVGPGFRDEVYPGYPTRPDSHVAEINFKDRDIQEISFDESDGGFRIGAFRAFDFFGDGSFYLLHTPGHTAGHMSGLARTTTGPDTFIFMGGDISHHGGEFRPSENMPIPDEVQYPSTETSLVSGAEFRLLNVQRGRKEDEPFFDPVLATDVELSKQAIRNAQVADASDNVFLVCAHDMGIDGVVDFYPQKANAWKQKGWKEKSRWNFLTDMAPAASAVGKI